jgi:hypothetical protein
VDRAAGFEPVGREFESLRARQRINLALTVISYNGQRVYIKHVLSHGEYGKGDWKK